MSAPMNASAVFIIKVDIRWNEEAENIKNDIASVNIRDIFELRGQCASIFFFMTWCNLRSQQQIVLMQIHRSNRSKYSKSSTQINVSPMITRMSTMLSSMNTSVHFYFKML